MNNWQFNPPPNLLPEQIGATKWNLNFDWRLNWSPIVGNGAGFGYREGDDIIYAVSKYYMPDRIILHLVKDEINIEVGSMELGMRLAEKDYYGKN